jgi:integrase
LEGYTFHSLRHSRITHLAIRELDERGVVDELSLSKFAGHLKVESTRTYVHLAAKYLAFGRRHGEGT